MIPYLKAAELIEYFEKQGKFLSDNIGKNDKS